MQKIYENGKRMELKMLLVLSKTQKAQASKHFFSHFLGGSLGDLGYFWGKPGMQLETQAVPIPSAWPGL